MAKIEDMKDREGSDHGGSALGDPALAELDVALAAAQARQKPETQAGALADRVRERTAVGRAWSLAIEMAAAVGVGVFIGWWVDRWFGSAPWGILGFALLGTATAMYTAVRTGIAMNRAAERGE